VAAPIEKGSRIGPYEIKELLGKGGMASVYKAFQPSLERDVAIKIMADQFAHDPQFAERFRREARSIARLRHPNILTVYDAGEENGLLYIVMEIIEGPTLKDEMKARPLSIEESLNFLQQTAAALDYANRTGIIHRDIKPSNVLIDRAGGRAVLSDFGIAKLAEAGNNQLTATGLGVGTPDYMSPEQAQGEAVDARSDEYSLAVMAYEMLTGRVPFTGDTPIAVVMGHISRPLPSARSLNPEIPVSIEKVLEKALAKRKEDRYESAAAFNTALQNAWKDRHKTNEAPTQVINSTPHIPTPPPGTYNQPYGGQFGTNPGNSYGGQPPYAGQPTTPGYGGQYAPQNQYQPMNYAPGQYGQPNQPGAQLTPPPGQYGQPTQPGAQFTPPPGNYQNQSQPQVQKKGNNLFAIIGVIAAIAVVGEIFAVLMSGGNSTTRTTPTAQAAVPTATASAATTAANVPANTTQAPVATTQAPAATTGAATTAPVITTRPPVTTAAPAVTTRPPVTTQAPPNPGGNPPRLNPYDDPNGYWTVQVPDNWEATEEDNGVTFQSATDSSTAMFVGSEDLSQNGGSAANNAFVEAFLKEYFVSQGAKIDRTNKRRIDGVEGTIYEGTFTQSGVTLPIRMATFIKNDRFYLLLITSLQSQNQQMYGLLFDRILDTFKAK
jgi:eukaryotic-like serine/threonine-protein kinase